VDWILLLFVGLAVFAIRDILLLGIADSSKRFLPAVWSLFSCLALSWASERISRDEAFAILRSPLFYWPAIAGHALLWLILTRVRNAFVLASIPSPLQLFALGGLCWLLLNRASGWPWWTAGIAAASAWILVVYPCAALLPRRADNNSAAFRFAATANLSAILLVPMQQATANESADPAIDWMATLLPLAITAAMIGASYLFHRSRLSGKQSRS